MRGRSSRCCRVRVLLVKMSSLGDVIHALPAVTDAAARGVEFDWVVEEAFAPIVRRHPGVRKVLPIAWRRWRKRLWTERGSLDGFLRDLRTDSYDLVLDAQGLLKSAAVTTLARGRNKTGFGFTSAREPAVGFFYGRRVTVPRDRHAVDRLRLLFARALGYPDPTGSADFGLIRQAPAQRGSGEVGRCLLLHGTTWPSKHWPERMWRSLAETLAAQGWEVALPWGDDEERERAGRIAGGLAGVRVLEPLPLDGLVDLISAVDLVIGVDSGLVHLAGACGTPTVGLYGATDPVLTGCRGGRVINLQSDLHCAPCLKRQCGYRGEPLRWQDEVVSPPCYARLTPGRIRDEAMKLLEAR